MYIVRKKIHVVVASLTWKFIACVAYTHQIYNGDKSVKRFFGNAEISLAGGGDFRAAVVRRARQVFCVSSVIRTSRWKHNRWAREQHNVHVSCSFSSKAVFATNKLLYLSVCSFVLVFQERRDPSPMHTCQNEQRKTNRGVRSCENEINSTCSTFCILVRVVSGVLASWFASSPLLFLLPLEKLHGLCAV